MARTVEGLKARILPVMEAYRQTANAIWLNKFVESGMPLERAETVLNLTLNLVRGMAVNSLWRKDEKLYRQQLEVWVALMHSTLLKN